MTSRPPNDRGPGGSQHDSSSPYKRSRPQSPTGSQMRPGPAYYQDPRFGMAVAAVVAGGYGTSIYRDPFQPNPQAVESHVRDVREQYNRERLSVPQPTSRDAELLQLHKQRRPTLLDYPHGTQSGPGVDRSRQYRAEPPSAYGQHYRQDSMGNLQGGLPVSLSTAQTSGPTTSKRPRLGPIDRPDLAQPLSIDVSQTEPKREPAYNPQTEAISPTLPPEETLKVQKIKDDLLQNISRIDREIGIVEQQIQMKLKKKQQQEEAARTHKEFVDSEEVPEISMVDMKHQSIAQIIYAENRKKAAEAHNILSKMGPKVDLPLYNQPSDAPIYHENKRKFAIFKPRLILHFKKRHQARKIRERYLTQRYEQLMQAWVKKVEKWENNPKKKAKDAKLREYFEKIFPELKKARDDKERLSRGTGRTGLPVYARSEAELEQIMDGIHEQEEEDRKMRNLAVVPPMMLDARERSYKFVNKNGLITDCMEEYKERKYYNVWTAQEKQIFKEKYLQHPKNFGLIASFLEKKNTMDCVEYYYRSKKSENYKQMLRKQTVKKNRQQKKAQPQNIIPKEEGLEPIASSSDLASQAGTSSEDNVNMVTSLSGEGGMVRSESTVSTTTIKDKEDEDKDTVYDSSDDNDTGKGVEGEGGVHPCAICKTQLEHYGLSRPLTTKNCELYGIIQSDLRPDMRVCSNCWCKSVRRRYTLCPVPSCKTPKRKVKRLRPLPTKWADMPAAMKEPIMKELQITDETMKCCSACFNRIARKIGTTLQPTEMIVSGAAPAATREPEPPSKPESSQAPAADSQVAADSAKWTDEEIELAKKGLRDHGKDWAAIATVVGSKSESQCSAFYNSNKKKYNLESIAAEKEKEDDNRTISICESMASTVTAPSDGEQQLSDNEENRMSDDSGTASAPSPRPLDDRDISKDQKPESSRPDESGPEVTTTLANQKSLSTSEGSLRSIPDNDSTATLSADEGGPGEGRPAALSSSTGLGVSGLIPAQQQTLYPGSILTSALPTCRSDTLTQRGLAQVGAMSLGLVPRPVFSPGQSSGGASFSSRPGSRASPGAQGLGVARDNRPNSRPSSSHEVPIIREANMTQGPGNPSVIDFSQGMKPYSPYPPGRDPAGQPKRPSSALSEPGSLSHRALSPHISHMMIGLDPSRVGTPPQDKKTAKQATCVRDLIHSAIERNLQDPVERPVSNQDRPRSSEPGYRPGAPPGAPGVPHDLSRAADLRKDPRSQGYDPRGSPYSMPGREPRDVRGDPRDLRGQQSGGIDLSIRQPDGVDKVAHGYKGDPRDFDPHGPLRPGDPYRGQGDDPQQRKVMNTATPPPAHSHSRSSFQIQETMKGRGDNVEKYMDRHSPNVRGLPPASSPYSPHGGKIIGPPPPLINSTSSRLPKSPPQSHLQAPPSGSITHGTPMGPHAITATSPSGAGIRPQQPSVARGSITQGTPVREAGMGRGMAHPEQGAQRGQGQYDIRMMEQMRGVHQQQMFDPRAMEQLRMHHPGYQPAQYPYSSQQPSREQSGDYNSTKQTILSDFLTSRQMGHQRHQPSPTGKEVRDPRDPGDQSISPRAHEYQAGPSPTQKGVYDGRTGYHLPVTVGMYMSPGQPSQAASRVSPRPSMPSPRDDKSGSPWMMGQRPSPGGHPSPHIEQGHQFQGQPPQSRPSITQGTGRQTVITDPRSDDRYRNLPDSSGTHLSPRIGSGENYLPVPNQSGDHRRSPAIHPEYARQMERERQEKEMKEREQQMAIRAAKEQYAQGLQRFNEERKQQEAAESRASDRAREEYMQKMRNEAKGSPKLTQPTDILKAFAMDQQRTQGSKPPTSEQQSKGGNRSMTAACLIDAIIVHQINQSTEETPTSSTAVSQAGPLSGMKQEVRSNVPPHSSSAPYQMYRQSQSHPSQVPSGLVGQGQQYMPQGQPPVAGQGQTFPGQQFLGQGQKGQQESKSPPAQMAGKKRWMQSPVTPPGSGAATFSPGSSSKSDPDSRPDSRPSSRGSGGTPARQQESALRQAVLGNTEGKQMTLGDHINTIILMDYEKKKDTGPPPGGRSFLSQINGSIQPESSTTNRSTNSSRSGSAVSSSSTTSESTTTWSNASSSTGVTHGDARSKSPAAFPGHKKFNKWRQANEQASSTGPAGGMEPGGAVSQSGSEEPGSRSQEMDWTRQMRPDQSHSPNVTGGQQPSPPGQADSSSSVGSGLGREGKPGGSKASSIQDSEVSPLEYVQNKIAQCLQDETPDSKPGQGHSQGPAVTESMARRSPAQLMPQPSHSASKSRTQSPVSSHMLGMKENSHKHPRPEPRQGGSVVSTSAESLQARPQEMLSVSPSSSSHPSPDQHLQDEEGSRGGYPKMGSQVQSPVSSAGDGRDQVHSSQHPLRKGRMFSRPRSRMEQEEPERKQPAAPSRENFKQAQRVSPSPAQESGGKVAGSSEKKGPKSEYDFPDSPDEEARGKPLLSSYMALSSSTRSPRRGIVDSSENRMASGDGGRDGEGNVESSEDAGGAESKADSGSGKENEAQGFERFGSEAVESSRSTDSGRKDEENQVTSRLGPSSMRKQSLEADDGSNISQTSADSTDRLMVDESANIDSSAGGEVSSAGGSRRGSKSSRESDNSPHPSTELAGSSEHAGHGRQGARSRSPRSYPQSSSDLGSSTGAGSSVQYSRRGPQSGDPGVETARDQEPQPLLSSQYETLSDDEQS